MWAVAAKFTIDIGLMISDTSNFKASNSLSILGHDCRPSSSASVGGKYAHCEAYGGHSKGSTVYETCHRGIVILFEARRPDSWCRRGPAHVTATNRSRL